MFNLFSELDRVTQVAIPRESVLYRRLMIGGADDISRRLDALDWPADGKDYGCDPIYLGRDGVVRVRVQVDEFDWREP